MRLTLTLSLLAAVAIVVLAIIVYTLIRQSMIHQLDHALEDKLRFFKAFCRQRDGVIGFTMSKTYWQRIRDPDDPEFFQYRFQNGQNIKQSASLGNVDLPLIGLGEGRLEHTDVLLPNGHRGRCAGISFYPSDVSGDDKAKLINVVVAHDGDRIWESLSLIKKRIMWVGALALAMLGFVTGWIVRFGMRPLVKLTEQVDSIPIGESGGRFQMEQATAEIQPVVDRLNGLMNRVEDAIRSERQFTANAAHELRNPIAGIMAQLELTLSDEGLSEDSRQSLEMVNEISGSLQRTVENLLQLARLETGSERIERGPVDVHHLLLSVWKASFEKAEERQLKVSWKLGDGLEDVVTSQNLLRLALSNLTGNAAEYTPEGGSIEIVARRTGGGMLEVVITNSVMDLSEEDVRQMFDRFWRSTKHAAVAHGHSGIGLNLCERIATALEGTVSAELVGKEQLKVTLKIPANESA